MTTMLGSYLDRRWWMKLITLFWCLGILRVNFFAISMLLVLHGLTPWPQMLNVLEPRWLGFMSRLLECRRGAPKDHWEHSEPKRLLGDWIGWGPSSTTDGWKSYKGRWIIDLGNMMGISYWICKIAHHHDNNDRTKWSMLLISWAWPMFVRMHFQLWAKNLA